MNVRPGTAADLRNYFRASEARMSLLSPEAAKTVAPGAKGKVHPEAVEVNNKRRSAKHQYSVGATKAQADAQAASAKALREAAAKAGHTGSRGPLPKAFLAQSKV